MIQHILCETPLPASMGCISSTMDTAWSAIRAWSLRILCAFADLRPSLSLWTGGMAARKRTLSGVSSPHVPSRGTDDSFTISGSMGGYITYIYYILYIIIYHIIATADADTDIADTDTPTDIYTPSLVLHCTDWDQVNININVFLLAKSCQVSWASLATMSLLHGSLHQQLLTWSFEVAGGSN